jgi:hypothetical protein
MSLFYIKNNNETARDFFDKRMIYKADVYNTEYSNLTDFNFAEKQLYGRVSRQFIPIIYRNYMVPLKNFRAPDDGPSPQALAFVVEAFNAMVAQFEKSARAQNISGNEQFLSQLRVYKAYESPTKLYGAHNRIYSETLGGLFKSRRANILNFNQFITRLLPDLEATGRKHPFTLPAFMKSTYCPMGASGLVIEIAELNPGNDEAKMTKFVQSLNWEYFLNACRQYGFMVDQLIPWRIVADIGSPMMMEYSKKYGLTSTDMILRQPYEYAHIRYFKDFKFHLLKLYNLSIEKVIYESKICSDGSTKMVTRRPMRYTPATIAARYDDLYFFELYATIRFFEEESPFTEQERNFLIDDCIEIARMDMESALYAFERILNKTFDYSGSLSYIKERIKKLKEATP